MANKGNSNRKKKEADYKERVVSLDEYIQYNRNEFSRETVYNDDLKVMLVEKLRHKWKMSIEEFLAVDEKYRILEYIQLDYYRLHLTGDDGMVEIIEQYINNVNSGKEKLLQDRFFAIYEEV